MFLNKKTAVYFFSAVFLLVIDRFLKLIALNNISKEIFGEWFRFNYVKNYYIAFSLPITGHVLNIIIAIIILWLTYYFVFLIKKPDHGEAGFLLLVIFGAASNFFDRLKFGYVIDYFDLSYFTVFNLSDAMIFLGVMGFLLLGKRCPHTSQ